jgi:hypothetical protein
MPIDPENLRLDHNHCRAICEEIGDRLRETMVLTSLTPPPPLQRLLDRLGELDSVWSPGIVPLIEDVPEETAFAVLHPV